MDDCIDVSRLRSIADQCGAQKFHSWCEWIDRHR
jgi:hypothetical protein